MTTVKTHTILLLKNEVMNKVPRGFMFRVCLWTSACRDINNVSTGMAE